ncbi:MAG: hypothetical protein E7680_01605 [Ruminococcaceae bacterium]|nr:hypothetical protein [Oscillospiraceae bacterium]
MILDAKQTTVAYRCPHCGSAVLSAVGLLSLTGSADLVKLKCTCGKSELSVTYGKDAKIRLSVPCLACGKPHSFTVSSKVFFGKELFTLPCPYTDLNIAATGEINQVKAEMARSELELLDLLEKSGIKDPERLRAEEQALPDPQIAEIVSYVIGELDEEGKIYCKCHPANTKKMKESVYDVEMRDEGVLVRCQTCGAERLIPTDSGLSAHAFLNADALYLE